MKATHLFFVTFFAATLHGQEVTPAPKKDPFAGFGNTGLDHRPNGKNTPSPFTKPLTQPMPASPGAAASSPGIALSNAPKSHLTEASGGQSIKMEDLKTLLSGYGSAESDTGPHPDVTVYAGPTMDSGLSQNCRITYLMPLAQAEALLFRSRGIVTVSRAVAPGFPDGLFIHTYDVKAGIYNRLCILTDSAQPQQQVVSLLLKAEGVNWYPPSPPWKKLERTWHTNDYMNTDNKGQPGIVIDTRVNDLRAQGRYIVINTTGGTRPAVWPSEVVKPAKSSPKEDSTWYVPEPLIKLMLFSLSQQLGQ
jgi:hypothetical protein